MNIGIITLYNSANCGSILQAYSLYSKVSELGHNPTMIKTGARSIARAQLRSIAGDILRCNLYKLRNDCLSYFEFTKFVRDSFSVRPFQELSGSLDAYILGSDEIWNLSRTDMVRYPIFWGVGLNPDRTMSYAPSINTADSGDLLAIPSFTEMISSLREVSVRDFWSQHEIYRATGRCPEVVIDPTMMNPESYSWLKEPGSIVNGARYLLVYAYPGSLDHFSEIISQYATKEALITVSLGWYHSWCDVNIPASLSKFVNAFYGATCIITNTFHGTAFAILSKRPFAVAAGANLKVRELLRQFGALDHELRGAEDGTEAGDELHRCLSVVHDMDRIQNSLLANRRQSTAYLSRALNSLEEGN